MSWVIWTLSIIVTLCLIVKTSLRRLKIRLWGKDRPAAFRLSRNGRQVVLQLRDLQWQPASASSVESVNVLLLELSIPDYFLVFKSNPIGASERPPFSVVASGVTIVLQYNADPPSAEQQPNGIGSLMARLLPRVLGLILQFLPSLTASITIRDFSIAYPVKGIYPVSITVEQLDGNGNITPDITAAFDGIAGQIKLDAMPVASYTCKQPSLKTSCDSGGAFAIDVSGKEVVLALREAHCLAAASKLPGDEASAAVSLKGSLTQQRGFSATSDSLRLSYTAAAVEIQGDICDLRFRASDDPVRLSNTVTLKEVVGKAMHPNDTTATPLSLQHVTMLYHFSTPQNTSSGGGSTDDGFELVNTADSIATRAASGAIPSNLHPTMPLHDPQSIPTLPAELPASFTPATNSTSLCQTDDKLPTVATEATAGNTRPGCPGGATVLQLSASGMSVNLQQQERAFKVMSSAAGEVLSQFKALLAIVAARACSTARSASSAAWCIDAAVADAAIRIDNSTAKMEVIRYGTSTGARASKVDVQVVTVVPMISCRMESCSFLQPEGIMAVEQLVLEAGRLGKLLLFKLSAQGVGYTSETQEMVLIKWGTELAGARVMGGDRWSGTLERTAAGDDGHGSARSQQQQQQITRRITVPPGVQLTQVFRLARSLPEETVQQEPLQLGILTLRQLDTSCVHPPATSAPSALLQKIPPAGFGLDFLPGFRGGLCFDFAVQPLVVPGLPTRKQGLSAAANLFKAVLRR